MATDHAAAQVHRRNAERHYDPEIVRVDEIDAGVEARSEVIS